VKQPGQLLKKEVFQPWGTPGHTCDNKKTSIWKKIWLGGSANTQGTHARNGGGHTHAQVQGHVMGLGFRKHP
jgi:hypothetical protein